VDKDEAEAVKWYRKAVEQGTRPAIRVLARNYRRGIGVEKDEAEASRWQQQLE
jgi:TPR repeat protein